LCVNDLGLKVCDLGSNTGLSTRVDGGDANAGVTISSQRVLCENM
jgi:hypothetical protein